MRKIANSHFILESIKETKIVSIVLIFIFQIIGLLLALGYNIGEGIENLTSLDLYSPIAIIITTLVSTVLANKLFKGKIELYLISLMLFTIGVILVYRLSPVEGRSQLKFFIIGVAVYFLTYFVLKRGKNWHKHIVFYFSISIFLFVITLILGVETQGANNWVNIGSFSFQPSEFIKVPFAFFIASYYTYYEYFNRYRLGKFIMILGVYIFIMFFFLQKELGTAVIFFGVMILSQFTFDKNKKFMLINILFMILGLILAYFLFNHIRVRVSTWLNPWEDPQGIGYQITQSLFAISSGGWFGSGIGLGFPSNVPVAVSDFIFSAICEEMGIFMGVAIVFLYLILMYQALRISMKQDNKFYSVLAFVIGSMFALQAFIIIAGVLKLIPLTGVTLPFVSRGGSSMVAGFIMLACLQYAQNVRVSDEVD